jgi:hypothetical protein
MLAPCTFKIAPHANHAAKRLLKKSGSGNDYVRNDLRYLPTCILSTENLHPALPPYQTAARSREKSQETIKAATQTKLFHSHPELSILPSLPDLGRNSRRLVSDFFLATSLGLGDSRDESSMTSPSPSSHFENFLRQFGTQHHLSHFEFPQTAATDHNYHYREFDQRLVVPGILRLMFKLT